jgi:hypothetical protein
MDEGGELLSAPSLVDEEGRGDGRFFHWRTLMGVEVAGASVDSSGDTEVNGRKRRVLVPC